MKAPTDPKEELLQRLSTSLLRDVFAAAALAAVRSSAGPTHAALQAFEQADIMVTYSNTPHLIEQLSKLKS